MKTVTFDLPKKVKKSLDIKSNKVSVVEFCEVINSVKDYATQLGAKLTIGFTVFDENREEEISDKLQISSESTTNLLVLLRQVLAREEYEGYPVDVKNEFLKSIEVELRNFAVQDVSSQKSSSETQQVPVVKPSQKSKKQNLTTVLLIAANIVVFSAILIFIGAVTKIFLIKIIGIILPIIGAIYFGVLLKRLKNNNLSFNVIPKKKIAAPVLTTSDVKSAFERQTQAFDETPEVVTKQVVNYKKPQTETNEEVEETLAEPIVQDFPTSEEKEERNDMPQFSPEPFEEELPDFEVKTKEVETDTSDLKIVSTNVGNHQSAKEWRSQKLKEIENKVLAAKQKDLKAIEEKEKTLDAIEINSRADGVKAMVLIEEIAGIRMSLEAKWE